MKISAPCCAAPIAYAIFRSYLHYRPHAAAYLLRLRWHGALLSLFCIAAGPRSPPPIIDTISLLIADDSQKDALVSSAFDGDNAFSSHATAPPPIRDGCLRYIARHFRLHARHSAAAERPPPALVRPAPRRRCIYYAHVQPYLPHFRARHSPADGLRAAAGGAGWLLAGFLTLDAYAAARRLADRHATASRAAAGRYIADAAAT